MKENFIKPDSLAAIPQDIFERATNRCIQEVFIECSNFTVKAYLKAKVNNLTDKMLEDWDEYIVRFYNTSSEDTDIKQKDNINPQHYLNGKVECIDAIEAATINKKGIEAVLVGNTLKYLWRYESKNGIEDVYKSLWYLNRLIKTLEKNKK